MPKPTGANWRRIASALFLLALAAGGVAVAIGLPWRLAVAQIAPAWLGVAVAVNLLEWPIGTAAWRLLAPASRPVGWRRMSEIVAITAAAQNTLPFFGGQAAMVILLEHRGRQTRGAALSMLATDQLFTGVVKVLALGAALLIAPVPGWMGDGAAALLALVGLFFAAMAAAAHGAPFLRRLALKLPSVAARSALAFAEWTGHMESMRSIRRVCQILGMYLGKKAIELAAALVAQQACGIALDVQSAVLVVAAIGLSTSIPRVPASLGIYEAAVLFVYEWRGIPADKALAAALLQHIAFLIAAAGSGYLILMTQRLRARPLHP
jgi:uncharacterized membrane protein YbhN (UPF0104 family)